MAEPAITTKICRVCSANKLLTDFYKTTRGIGGVMARCKLCYRAEQTPAKRSAERARAAAKAGKQYNPSGHTGIRGTPEQRAIRQAEKNRQLAQRVADKKAKRASAAAEREERIAIKPWLDPSLTAAERFRLRYRGDPEFNLKQRMRAAFKRKRQGIKIGDLLRGAIVRDGRSPTVEAFVGYSAKELKIHLERQFTGRMSWGAFAKGRIHIDHIIPLASFNIADTDELKRAWAITNLRPLWAEDNLRKSAQVVSLL